MKKIHFSQANISEDCFTHSPKSLNFLNISCFLYFLNTFRYKFQFYPRKFQFNDHFSQLNKIFILMNQMIKADKFPTLLAAHQPDAHTVRLRTAALYYRLHVYSVANHMQVTFLAQLAACYLIRLAYML